MHFYEDPTFWVAVSFVILVVAVAKPVWRVVTSKLDEQIAEIQTRMEEARRLRNEAQELVASAKHKLAEAEREAQAIVEEARKEAESVARRMAEDAEASLKRRERMAMDRIAQAEADAAAEIRALTADVALEATRQILAKQVQGERANSLIDKSIAELGDKLH